MIRGLRSQMLYKTSYFFMPLGFLDMLAAKKMNLSTLLKIGLMGSALSVFVETAQVMTTDRTTTITDQ